jgi:hypothetical protein
MGFANPGGLLGDMNMQIHVSMRLNSGLQLLHFIEKWKFAPCPRGIHQSEVPSEHLLIVAASIDKLAGHAI